MPAIWFNRQNFEIMAVYKTSCAENHRYSYKLNSFYFFMTAEYYWIQKSQSKYGIVIRVIDGKLEKFAGEFGTLGSGDLGCQSSPIKGPDIIKSSLDLTSRSQHITRGIVAKVSNGELEKISATSSLGFNLKPGYIAKSITEEEAIHKKKEYDIQMSFQIQSILINNFYVRGFGGGMQELL